MRTLVCLVILAGCPPAHAQYGWIHNGSHVTLFSDRDSRTIEYAVPRPGLSVTAGTVLFRGNRNGNHYSGTAYVFSSACGAFGYRVNGTVNPDRRNIVLRGQAPRIDSSCNIVRYVEDVLVFTFQGCGCECGKEPELAAFQPNLTGDTSPDEGTSCPYLYAWAPGEQRWLSYGKVIRDARGPHREMSEIVPLTAFAVRFRLAEEELEHSFIDSVELRIMLKNGTRVVLAPTNRTLASRDKKRLYIAAFRSVEFEFKPPRWMRPEDVSESSLAIVGYYETLDRPQLCPIGPKGVTTN